jgi:tetratricopeptide (TPR) repeat protein
MFSSFALSKGDTAMMTLEEFYEKLDTYYEAGDVEGAESYLKHTARLTQPCCGGFSELHLSSVSELGGLYKAVSRYADAVSMFRVAEDMILQHLGSESVEYATNANNAAGAYRLMGDYDNAAAYFDKAKVSYERTVGTDNYMYSSMLNNIALLKNDTGDVEGAIEYAERALAAVENMNGADEEAATSYANLAALYKKAGEDGKARKSIDKALELFAKIPGSSHYPAALNGKASICFMDGDYAKAAELYREALEKVEALFGENIEFAIANENLAKALVRTGDAEGAKQYMKKAEEAYIKIYGAEHEKSGAIKEELKALENTECGL